VGNITPSKPQPADSRLVQPTKPIEFPVSVSFRYCRPGEKYCLSGHGRDEVKAAMNCLRKLTTLAWRDVLAQGGRGGNKTGLGHTIYGDHQLKHVSRPAALSQEVKISALRASQKSRIFGAYRNQVYYLLWFDRNHEIVPAG
jgi:hypothetical protein